MKKWKSCKKKYSSKSTDTWKIKAHKKAFSRYLAHVATCFLAVQFRNPQAYWKDFDGCRDRWVLHPHLLFRVIYFPSDNEKRTQRARFDLICERLKCCKPGRESNSSMSLISHPRVSAVVISLQQDGRKSADDLVRWGRIKPKPRQLLPVDPWGASTNSSPGINKLQPYLKSKHVATAA